MDKHLLDPEQESEWSVFSKLKTDPGRVGLASVLKEIAKLKSIDNIQLPCGLFADVQFKTLERYRSRVASESVQELKRRPESIRYPLLAAFCWQRHKTIIDNLIELMIQMIHRISARAEKKGEQKSGMYVLQIRPPFLTSMQVVPRFSRSSITQ